MSSRRLRRIPWLAAVVVAACMPGRAAETPPDVKVDAPIDTPSGSAGRFDGFEASPRDSHLEYGVLATSAIIVVGPASMRRRRRARQG